MSKRPCSGVGESRICTVVLLMSCSAFRWSAPWIRRFHCLPCESRWIVSTETACVLRGPTLLCSCVSCMQISMTRSHIRCQYIRHPDKQRPFIPVLRRTGLSGPIGGSSGTLSANSQQEVKSVVLFLLTPRCDIFRKEFENSFLIRQLKRFKKDREGKVRYVLECMTGTREYPH